MTNYTQWTSAMAPDSVDQVIIKMNEWHFVCSMTGYSKFSHKFSATNVVLSLITAQFWLNTLYL